MKGRPIGVTILAIAAGILAFLAAIHTLQALGILPYFIGPFAVRGFNLWNAFMWGLMVWVYAWLVQMLWRVDPSAWLFLAVISVFNLCINFIILVTGGGWYDVNVSVILNAIILIYIMLPGVKKAFGQS